METTQETDAARLGTDFICLYTPTPPTGADLNADLDAQLAANNMARIRNRCDGRCMIESIIQAAAAAEVPEGEQYKPCVPTEAEVQDMRVRAVELTCQMSGRHLPQLDAFLDAFFMGWEGSTASNITAWAADMIRERTYGDMLLGRALASLVNHDVFVLNGDDRWIDAALWAPLDEELPDRGVLKDRITLAYLRMQVGCTNSSQWDIIASFCLSHAASLTPSACPPHTGIHAAGTSSSQPLRSLHLARQAPQPVQQAGPTRARASAR